MCAAVPCKVRLVRAMPTATADSQMTPQAMEVAVEEQGQGMDSLAYSQNLRPELHGASHSRIAGAGLCLLVGQRVVPVKVS